MKKVLITGVTGFVGKHTARALLKTGLYNVTAIVRPNTAPERLKEFTGKIKIIEIDLCDLDGLQNYLETENFYAILHIGALLRQRKFSEKEYFLANVEATEILAKSALQNKTKFIFCSSVGVYGTIPPKVPAGKNSVLSGDSLYYKSKIEAEKRLKILMQKGLNCNIVRPSIIYGTEDKNGFPNILINLVRKRKLFFPRKAVKFHLTSIELLVEVFLKILDEKFSNCFEDIVVDDEPVILADLADFISQNLGAGRYGKWHKLPNFVFSFARFIFQLFALKEFKKKLDFLCSDWYYRSEFKKSLNIEKKYFTIPGILPVIKELDD